MLQTSARGFGRGSRKAVAATISLLLAPAAAQAEDRPPATDAELEPVIVVIGKRSNLDTIPGSGMVLDQSLLEESHVFSVNEALRKVPGVFARDEEGFGLRPNLGIRGLNPTRSAKLLMLEDGIPLAYAPYGDNASYYHPPVNRFERIEVLKGSSQIMFGPQTLGGLINYITPGVPAGLEGSLGATLGSEDYVEFHGQVGDTIGRTGYLLDGTWKESDGTRENMHFEVGDVFLKVVQQLTDSQALTLRGSYYDEDSQVTYSGLTLAEWDDDPRSNPFKNDFMYATHWATSATHQFDVNDGAKLLTSAYYTYFNRDWWRQSSNSGQRPERLERPGLWRARQPRHNLWQRGSTAPVLDRGHRASPQPRARAVRRRERARHRTALSPGAPVPGAGERRHAGRPATRHRPQCRHQGRQRSRGDGVVRVRAEPVRLRTLHGHARPALRARGLPARRQSARQPRHGERGRVDPGHRRDVRGGAGHDGFRRRTSRVLAAGRRGHHHAHRRHGGPRARILVELRARHPQRRAQRPCMRRPRSSGSTSKTRSCRPALPAAQAPGSRARARRCSNGLEVAGNIESNGFVDWPVDVFGRLSWTWLWTAEYVGDRYSTVPGSTSVKVTGNRLPYTPEQLFTGTIGMRSQIGLAVELEGVYTSAAYTDDLNTVEITPNGQRGQMPGYTIWNLSANYPVAAWNCNLFLAVKNVTDELYVVDMSRGLIPGMPRLVQGGFQLNF